MFGRSLITWRAREECQGRNNRVWWDKGVVCDLRTVFDDRKLSLSSVLTKLNQTRPRSGYTEVRTITQFLPIST